MLVNLIRLLKGNAKYASASEHNDSVVRLTQCLRVLTQLAGAQANSDPAAMQTMEKLKKKWAQSDEGRESLLKVLALEKQSSDWMKEKANDEESAEKAALIAPNEAIMFRQLRRDGRDRARDGLDFDDDADFILAAGQSARQ